ncbi:MAG: LPS export ABC transporter permease LptF [bacterium]
MFPIIDRMLLQEVFKTLAVIVLVVVLLLLGNTLVRFLGQVAEGLLSLEIMFVLVGVSMLQMLSTIIPAAFFFSILWVLGRMYRDSEMAALAAVGVGTTRLYRALMVSAIPVTLLVAWLVLDIYPAAKYHARTLKLSQASNVSLKAIQAGEFNEFNQGKIVIFAREVRPEAGELEGIFVQHEQNGKPGLVVAKHASLVTHSETGHRYIVLKNGYRYQGEPDEPGFALAEFAQYGLRIPEFDAVKPGGKSMGRKSSWDLWQSDDIRARAELQFRLSFPLAVLAFTIIAVPLSRQLPRQGIYGKLIFAVLFFALYMNMQKIAEKWMEEGLTPAWMGMWWLPVVTVSGAALLTYMNSPAFALRRRARRS